MADQAKHQTLMAAGCPAEHCDKVAALGLTPEQVKQATAAGIDWTKLLGQLPQLIALLVSLFGKQPTP